jgi:anti-sigma regulatory factor (Ser/Thr protein kinase)
MGYIKHNGKKYRSVLIRLSSETDFSEILDEFHNLFIVGMEEKKLENIRYSLLELVNNSIRAHKERESDDFITLRFTIEEKELIIVLQDRGGGFDKSGLPYDLDEDVHEIDINDDSFMDYRERHGYNRFGMGLLVTKRTFDAFILRFVDEEGILTRNYNKGETAGTHIELRSLLEI